MSDNALGLLDPGSSGQAAGSQALFNQLLQAVTKIANAMPGVQVGNWTPTLLGDGAAGAPVYPLNGQVGSYERVGRLVTARYKVQITAIGGMTGNLLIGGLPFAPTTAANDVGWGGVTNLAGITYSGGYTALALDIQPGGVVARVLQTGSGVAALALPIAGVAAATTLEGIAIYRTN